MSLYSLALSCARRSIISCVLLSSISLMRQFLPDARCCPLRICNIRVMHSSSLGQHAVARQQHDELLKPCSCVEPDHSFDTDHETHLRCTPLVDAVMARGNQLQQVPLHVPGHKALLVGCAGLLEHKRGRALDSSMKQLMDLNGTTASGTGRPRQLELWDGPAGDSDACTVNPLRFDLTELSGLDYLSSPTSVIKAAQDLAAAAFNAQRTWFLVNGCSVAIQAAVMAAVKPRQALLLARNCHLSAFSACILSDAVPVWLQPEEDALHGIAHCVTSEQLRHGFQAAKQQGLKVGAVLIVSPTYYGAVAKVSELAELCHAEGVPLLVDEAHGAHFSPMAKDLARQAPREPDTNLPPSHQAAQLTPSPIPAALPSTEDAHKAAAAAASASSAAQQGHELPLSALDAGADLVMQSTHKVLTAMTQAAMLHLGHGGRVQADRISTALQVLQTSSPSYILLSSLDAARQHAFAPHVWQTPMAAAAAARAQLTGLPGLSLLPAGGCNQNMLQSVAGFDPLRLVLNVHGLGLTGYDAAVWLEEKHGIVPELATQKLVVFVFGPGSTLEDAEALVHACQQLSLAHSAQASSLPPGPLGPELRTSSSIQNVGNNGSDGSSNSSRSGPHCNQQHQHGQERLLDAPRALPGLTPRQAFFADTEAVPLHAAAGQVSAELLCPYPPGVPVVFPGEHFSDEVVQLLQATLAAGGVVTGGHDAQLRTVLVVVAAAAD